MRLVIQRVLSASVTVENKVVNEIKKGLCILVGFEEGDNKDLVNKTITKILKLRIFEDSTGLTNISLENLISESYQILLISQFTLLADTNRGNRPSFTNALKANEARQLYEFMVDEFNNFIPTKPGVFQADMKLTLTNDGPFTIVLNERNNK